MATKSNYYQKTKLTIPLARKLITSHTLTPTQLTTYCHEIATKTQTQFNAFTNIFPLSETLQDAKQSDIRHRHNKPKSILDGIPISIKCNISIKDKSYTAGSHMLDGVIGYDSYVVERLKNCGAILIGLTNMDEFGMGSLGNNCHTGCGYSTNPIPFQQYHHQQQQQQHHHGIVSNDNNLSIEEWITRIESLSLPEYEYNSNIDNHNNNNNNNNNIEILSPGGSSSGSAVSVALGSSLASIGTDTGGSVRLPAAWCGVVGLKPTYGAISRKGVISYASSLDTVGIIANTVQCATMVLDEVKNNNARNDDDDDDDNNVTTIEQLGDATSCFIGPLVNPSSSSSSSWWLDDNDDNNENKDIQNNNTNQTPTSTSTSILKGMKIGIPNAFSIKECPTQIIDAWERTIQQLESNGATIQSIPERIISPSCVKMALPSYYVISCAEASSNLSRYDGLKYGLSINANDANANANININTSFNKSLDIRERNVASSRGKGFGSEVKRRVLAGTAVLSSDRFHTFYEAAATVRATITSQFNDAFYGDNNNPKYDTNDDSDNDDDKYNGVDLIIIPTALTNPPSLVATKAINEDAMNSGTYTSPDTTEAFQNDIMTTPISLAGLPSISIPVWDKELDKGNDDSDSEYHHPVVGMQIVGPKLSEGKILHVANILEKGLDYDENNV